MKLITAEIIEIQDEIINKQEFMIHQMALQLDAAESWNKEEKCIEELKSKLEARK